MTEVFLGVIAVATLVMALIQLGLVVGGIIAVKRVNEMLTRVEASAKPVLAHVDELIVDTKASLAAARSQVDRVERQTLHVLTRTEQAVQRVEGYLVAPAREGIALVAGARALLSAFRMPLLRIIRSAIG